MGRRERKVAASGRLWIGWSCETTFYPRGGTDAAVRQCSGEIGVKPTVPAVCARGADAPVDRSGVGDVSEFEPL